MEGPADTHAGFPWSFRPVGRPFSGQVKVMETLWVRACDHLRAFAELVRSLEQVDFGVAAQHLDNAENMAQQAIARLGTEGRKLILCGISTPQYKAMDHFGLIQRLGHENVCPDLEFAIARGLELTETPEVPTG